MTIGSITQNMSNSYTQLSTGSRINSAADDAAGLAISEKLSTQETGVNKGTENTQDMQNLIKTADAALSGINDALQQIRELSIQASNGTYTDEDKQILQKQVDDLKKGIEDIIGSAEFNGQKLLDGSFQNKNTASSADGTGTQVTIKEMSLETLGIKNFDLTGDFDIRDIDNAINMVNEQRSELGANDNAMSYTINSNDIISLNLADARSRIADTDMAKAATEMNKAKLMQQYQIYMQKNKAEQEKSKLNIIQF